jgi:hypothetical protein
VCSASDDALLDIFLDPIRVCASYKPKFGIANGEEAPTDLTGFKVLFGSDPLYAWIGLDSELMYAAHKAAGGMTSIYRQVGVGCEKLFRAIVQDRLGLSTEQLHWSYEIPKQNGQMQRLTLDARIDREDVLDERARERVADWLRRSAEHLGLAPERRDILRGAIFEVRQGYKSADSKRQNADLRFGLRAAGDNYLPVILIVSNQVSQTVAVRYRASSMMVLTGTLASDDTTSTYAFCENILCYSLSGFFERNSPRLKAELESILKALLSGDGSEHSP